MNKWLIALVVLALALAGAGSFVLLGEEPQNERVADCIRGSIPNARVTTNPKYLEPYSASAALGGLTYSNYQVAFEKNADDADFLLDSDKMWDQSTQAFYARRVRNAVIANTGLGVWRVDPGEGRVIAACVNAPDSSPKYVAQPLIRYDAGGAGGGLSAPGGV